MSAVLTSPKPRLRIVNGEFVQSQPDRLATARQRFGRRFAHEVGGNWQGHPERVLSRWGRRADYWNLNPNMQRPSACVCSFSRKP